MNIAFDIDGCDLVVAKYIDHSDDKRDHQYRCNTGYYEYTFMISEIIHLGVPDHDPPLNAEYESDFKQQRNNRGSSVTYERERYSRIGYCIGNYRDIKDDLYRNMSHESDYKQSPVQVGRIIRDDKASPQKEQEKHDNT